MRNIRAMMLAMLALITLVNPTTAEASAVPGGVSESQSEPRSTILPKQPKLSTTKWKRVTFKMAPTVKYWQKVAQCETGGNWKDKGNWGGGLGIAQSTWKGFGGLEFAKHPSEASMFEQIVVANRISVFGYQTKRHFRTLADKQANKPFFRDPVGFNGWGCIKNNRYLKPPSVTYSTRLPKGKSYYCPQFEPMFKKYALPTKVFSYIAWRESRCNPGAVNAKWENGQIVWTLNSNGSYDSGLLQINSSWFKTLRENLGHSPEELFQPGVNAMFASWILHFSNGRLRNWNVRSQSS